MRIISPLDYRYGHERMKDIFTEDARLKYLLRVEVALAKAHAEAGLIEKTDADIIEEAAQRIKLSDVKEIEKRIKHDIMAMVVALSNASGESGKYVHLGATSSDIIDTALSLQLKDAARLIDNDLQELENILMVLTEKTIELICVGRTHGQHAVPTTYGMKFGIWLAEVRRHRIRLREIGKRLFVGKLCGAVGTGAALGEMADFIEKKVMEYLKLKPVLIANQIIQRDRHAEFCNFIALLSQTCNKIALEIRNLQRTEIAELEEYFRDTQVGSSTMPQKKNPITAEQICGLTRVLKNLMLSELENIALWHERDLTNSAPERIIFSEGCVMIDHILRKLVDILEKLSFNRENIKKNLDATKGLICAEALMVALVKKGISRQVAHHKVRMLSVESIKKNIPLYEIAKENFGNIFEDKELKEIFRPENYIGSAVSKVKNLLRVIKNEDIGFF